MQTSFNGEFDGAQYPIPLYGAEWGQQESQIDRAAGASTSLLMSGDTKTSCNVVYTLYLFINIILYDTIRH